MTVSNNIRLGASADSRRQKPTRPKGRVRRIIFGSMFVLSIIFIMISVSFSWFVSGNGRADVNGLSVEVVSVNNLTLNELGDQTMTIDCSGLELYSISGDGKDFFIANYSEDEFITSSEDESYSLYGPKFKDYEALTDDEVRANALVHDFSLGIEGKVNVYLGEGSYVKAGEDPDTGEVLSPEYVEGAVRVAILKANDEGEYEVKCVWVPNVEAKADESWGIDNKISFVKATDVGGEQKIEETDVITTINSKTGSYTSGGVVYAWGAPGAENRISLGELEGRCNYRFVIWLEGTDRETTAAVMGEQIMAKLMFTPEDIVTNAAEQE